MCSTSFALFNDDVKILSKDEVSKLSNDDLNNVYIETAIEIEASRTFYGKSGFTPKEYTHFKDMLRYLVGLRMELQKREMKLPPVEDLTKEWPIQRLA